MEALKGLPIFSVLEPFIRLNSRGWTKILIFGRLSRMWRVAVFLAFSIPLRGVFVEFIMNSAGPESVSQILVPVLNQITLPWLKAIGAMLLTIQDALTSVPSHSWFWWVLISTGSFLTYLGMIGGYLPIPHIEGLWFDWLWSIVSWVWSPLTGVWNSDLAVVGRELIKVKTLEYSILTLSWVTENSGALLRWLSRRGGGDA
jgi:hypothetical protein